MLFRESVKRYAWITAPIASRSGISQTPLENNPVDQVELYNWIVRQFLEVPPRLEINRFSAQLRGYMMIVALFSYSLALLGFITVAAAGLVLYGVSRDHYLVASAGIIVFAVGALGWATLFLWVLILLVRDLYLFCRHSTKQLKILPNSKPTVEDGYSRP